MWSACAVTAPEDYVDIISGTHSRFDLSHGNILPEVVLPWGFNGWAPMTDNTQGNWWFHSDDFSILGIRLTHQPSPWIGDYGEIRIAASITDPSHGDAWQAASYDPRASTWLPYYFNATLLTYGNDNGFTTVEVTPTEHGAILRFNFPPLQGGADLNGFNQTRRVMVALNSASDGVALGLDEATGFVNGTGFTTSNSGGVTANFAHWFYFTVAGGPNGDKPITPFSTDNSTNSNIRWAVLDFDPSDSNTDTITLRIATSLISPGQAFVAHGAEVAGQSFEAVKATAKAAWNSVLSRVNVTDVGSGYTPAQEQDALTVFYSCMYRASRYPRKLWEVDASGAAVHWSPYDGKVHDGPLIADSGSWDGYRTTYPFLALTNPDTYSWMVQGFLNAYLEYGWLPMWPSPGIRGAMVGTHTDNIIADAIVKGIKGFNVTLAYQAIRQDAFVVPPGNEVAGRVCLQDYITLGYIPSNGGCSQETSRTLNYLLSDYSIAGAAASLGNTADAQTLRARAAGYSKIFEPTTGFFRTKDDKGVYAQPFDEYAWSGAYTEAGPWQYRFEVPYDPQGLLQLFSASGFDMCEQLQSANTMPSIYHPGQYGHIIHEQTEMATLCWGQWELNNQPVWALEWMFIASQNSTGTPCAANGQYWLRKSVSTLFVPGPDMYTGDEDNGSMSSWYLLTSLGLYSVAQGDPSYILGSPLFANVVITLAGGQTLTVSAVNQAPENVYVQGVTWNGVKVPGVSVNYFDLMKGGTLQFTMGASPL